MDISIQRPGKDPILECDYLVEIDGIPIAGFMEFTEPTKTHGIATYRDGNGPNYAYKQRGLETISSITLKRGIFAGERDLYDWYVSGIRKTIDVVDLKHARDDDRRVRTVRCYECLPKMWKDGKGNSLSEEAIQIFELEIELEDFDIDP